MRDHIYSARYNLARSAKAIQSQYFQSRGAREGLWSCADDADCDDDCGSFGVIGGVDLVLDWRCCC